MDFAHAALTLLFLLFFFNPKAKQNEVFFSGQENQVGVPFHIFDVVFLGLFCSSLVAFLLIWWGMRLVLKSWGERECLARSCSVNLSYVT